MESNLRAYPIPGVRNKFVITSEGSFFVSCTGETAPPSYFAIFQTAFDLEDESVVAHLDREFEEQRMVLGYFDPHANEIVVEFPVSPTPFATTRIREVIGG